MPTRHAQEFQDVVKTLETEYDVQDVEKFMRWLGTPNFDSSPETFTDFFAPILSWLEVSFSPAHDIHYGFDGTERRVGGNGESYSALRKIEVETEPQHGEPHIVAVSILITKNPKLVAKLCRLFAERDDIVWGIGNSERKVWIAPADSMDLRLEQ